MGKFNPIIVDKVRWRQRTLDAIGIDIDKKENRDKIMMGYAIPFYNPQETDPDLKFSFTIRLAHSPDYMDEGQKKRLEASLEYLMLGVSRIMTADESDLKELAFEKKSGSLGDYMATGEF